MAKYELTITSENGNLEVTQEQPITLSVLEVVGPRGEQGPQGPAGTTLLSGLSDVDTSNAALGKVLASDGDNTFSFVDVDSSTLDDVTNRGNTTTNPVTVGDLTADDTVVDSLEVNNIQQTSAEQTTIATTSATSVASFPASDFRSGKLIIQVKDNVTSHTQVSQLSVVHDASNAYTTEYSNLFTGSTPLATFEADIRSGTFHIDATPVSANSTNFKVLKTLIKL